jgi:hypothetical protein
MSPALHPAPAPSRSSSGAAPGLSAYGSAPRPRRRARAWRNVAVLQLLWAAWLGLACALPLRARAQPIGELVVVPFGVNDLTPALEATTMLEAELAEARVSLIPMHDARDRFTARSRPPQTASDSDLDVLAREAREAIEHVAFGRTAAAQKSVREVIQRAERTLESLNRETATARHILDACLSLVRTTLQAGKRDLALEQATRCRRLVPDLAPSEVAHPANVVGVLAEADNLLRRMRIGNLSVRSAPESNCSVYLNGRHLGTTPFLLDRAAAGDYRVQVECGRTLARVHVVQLGDQPASLVVDTQFDRAIASDPRLFFKYPSREEAREQTVRHAIELGRELHADDVILVGVEGERVELLRVNVTQQRLVGRASVPYTTRHGFARPALARAIVALSEARLQGEPTLVESSPPANVPPPESTGPSAAPSAKVGVLSGDSVGSGSDAAAVDAPHQAAPPSATGNPTPPGPGISRQRRLRRAGYALLGTSAAFFALGLGLDLRAQALEDELSTLAFDDELAAQAPLTADAEAAVSRQARQQSKFERLQGLRWIGVGSGAVALVATALLVEPVENIPWWGYALAATGAGVLAVGAYEVASSDRCMLGETDDGPCRRPRDSAARGALLISAALPLLSVPLVQLLKRPDGGAFTLTGKPLRAGLELTWSSSF